MSKAWAGGSDRRWREFRITILNRDKWLCTLQERGCTGRATQVHHPHPLSRGGAKYDPANATAACAWCNQVVGDRAHVPQPEPRPRSNWDQSI